MADNGSIDKIREFNDRLNAPKSDFKPYDAGPDTPIKYQLGEVTEDGTVLYVKENFRPEWERTEEALRIYFWMNLQYPEMFLFWDPRSGSLMGLPNTSKEAVAEMRYLKQNLIGKVPGLIATKEGESVPVENALYELEKNILNQYEKEIGGRKVAFGRSFKGYSRQAVEEAYGADNPLLH